MILPFLEGPVALLRTTDHHWYLRKQHATHFNSRKNRPGRTIEWYAAVRKMREEHEKSLTDPNYKVDTTAAETVGELLRGIVKDGVVIDDTPATT